MQMTEKHVEDVLEAWDDACKAAIRHQRYEKARNKYKERAARLAEVAEHLRAQLARPALVKIDPAEYADGYYTTPWGQVVRVEAPPLHAASEE